MNYVKFNVQNAREAILTHKQGTITSISDQEISNGDVLIHMMYSKPMDTGLSTFVVKEITEERLGKGYYPNNTHPTWRSMIVERHIIPYKELEEKGFVRVSQAQENGKTVTKAQLL